jgi:hypothetical protein
MAMSGRQTGARLAAAITAWAMSVSGGAVAASPPATTPSAAAIVGGGRALSADELTRAGRAIEAVPSTTIWQSRLPDGTLELSDRPPPAGASRVSQRSYTLPAQGVASKRADAEREYWSRQAERFNRRRQDRDRLDQAEAERRALIPPQGMYAEAGRPIWYGSPTVRPWPPHGVRPLPPHGGVVVPQPLPGPFQSDGSSPYTSSPGAVQGRPTGGFIGSGFATGR